MGSEAFKGPVYKQVGSLSRRLKIARLYNQNISGRVTLLPGTELRPSVSINVNKTRKHFSRNINVRACFRNVSKFPVSVFVFKMQIMLTLHGREF